MDDNIESVKTNYRDHCKTHLLSQITIDLSFTEIDFKSFLRILSKSYNNIY